MTAILSVCNLVKRFGGLTATDDVNLALLSGEIHAVIGPNGAGKTTLINQLTGEIRPDSGTIRLESNDITYARPAARVLMGIARTFQIPQLLPEFSAAENIALVVQSRTRAFSSLPTLFRRDRAAAAESESFLERVGLSGREWARVSELSHGERKQLELAIALALRPKILLLDEPMAGLGHAESVAMIETLAVVRGHISILLIEHDMDAVFRLANRISVLVYGKVIMCGSVEDVRRSDEVRSAYLGETVNA